MTKIIIQAVCIPYEGYGYLAIEMAKSLHRAGHDVKLIPAVGFGIYKHLDKETLSLIPAMRQQAMSSPTTEIDLAVVPPVHAARLSSKPVLHPSEAKLKCLGTMWEATKPPNKWVSAINSLKIDYLVVPHQSSRDCFLDSGVTKPCKVLTPGVDKTLFVPRARDMNGKFKFLTLGRLEPRKNPMCTINAFQIAFPKNKDVELILKTRADTSPKEIRDAALKDKRIKLVAHDLEYQELVNLYYEAHVFVFPSRGEGFSFPPRNAICSGIPAIVTNNTAMADIPGAIKIEPESYSPMASCTYTNGDEHEMLMADVNPKDVATAMLDVYNNYDKFANEAIVGAKEMLSWEEFPKHFIETLLR